MTLFHSLPRITTTQLANSGHLYRSQPYSASSPSSARPTLNPPYYSAPPTSNPSSSFSSVAPRTASATSMPMGSKKVKEEVWPHAVEKAFMEAIAEIPKLGRRKVPLHEKHYGRNELIAAYIYKETKQSRTRKQVSSHIQVLKNTRKEDLILMELLSDGSPDESNDPTWLEAAMVKIRKIFGEERLQDSPTSPTSPLSPDDNLIEPFELEKRRSFEIDDEERKPQHKRQLSIASILNPEPERDQAAERPSGGFSGFVPEKQGYSSSSAGYLKEETYPQGFDRNHSGLDTSWRERCEARYSEASSHDSSASGAYSAGAIEHSQGHPSSQKGSDLALSYRSERHAFWPSHFKLILEESCLYNTPGLPQLLNRESVLVEHSTPFHDSLQSEDIRILDETRFPYLKESFIHKRCLFIRCKMGLNLETFSRQARLLSKNLFQSSHAMTIRCTTTVYSFGKEVVGSVETKQATCHRDRFVYDFRIVDAWLEEFLRTLRGGANEEMESSLQNMTIVQEFSNVAMGPNGPDAEPRLEPLLVVAYEFFAGHGNLNTYRLTSGPPPASVRARSHTWDHPMAPWRPDQAGPWAATDDRHTHKRPSLEFEQEWPPQPKKYRREFQPAFNYA